MAQPELQQPAPRMAVALLAHGSRRSTATADGMREIQRRLQARLPGLPVALAFFEFLQPTLTEVVADFAARKFSQVVVLPYFLFAGREIQVDIPAELDHIRQQHPGVTLHLAEPLGLDDRLVAYVAHLVAGALDGRSQCLPVATRLPSRRDRGHVGVIVCNRGSRRQYDAGDRLRGLCARLQTHLGSDTLVEPAQAEYGEPDLTIETAASRLVQAGVRRIVIVPYLHFPGKVLAVNIVPATRRAQAAHPEARFLLAWTLCVNDAALDICVERVRGVREMNDE
ncbi:MAG TPA: CbiX/SirB N-terminal domain-containing protein [Thermomicrobiales bacterium]|nr:CbiX/SirB N-terminal domain-containing protein [Thermomicrobiales bacterium]